MATLNQADKYYKRKGLQNRVISDELRGEDEIVYGARSVNAQLPKYLETTTEDWDIATEDDPEQVAGKIEKKLDKRYGGNYFRVEPALHPGTYKIRSNVTNRGIVDVTIVEPDSVPHKKIGGINYATLDYQVQQIEKSLANPESKFRHSKDSETLQRIKLSKKKKAKKINPSLS